MSLLFKHLAIVQSDMLLKSSKFSNSFARTAFHVILCPAFCSQNSLTHSIWWGWSLHYLLLNHLLCSVFASCNLFLKCKKISFNFWSSWQYFAFNEERLQSFEILRNITSSSKYSCLEAFCSIILFSDSIFISWSWTEDSFNNLDHGMTWIHPESLCCSFH